MYTIHVDGKLLYQTGAEDEAQIALNVKPSLDIESAGSLSFVLPPGNSQYDAIQRMKSVITMHQDGRMIFRGRVTESERDIFNQKDVYCEGDLSFLLDSLWEEQTVTGNAQDLFRQMIANHNAQVEPEKQFTVGVITAVDADTAYEAETQNQEGIRRFSDTSTMIDERLLGVYGGYLRTRTEGGITYIDWLSDFGEESGQAICFGVNLLDLKDKMDAGDVFTCLIPLGYSEIGEDGTYEDPVNIRSVNNGLEYIQDDEAVAKYGRIWRSKTWGNTKDPAQLLNKGWEYMKTGAEMRTLTLKAVDMHFIRGDISMLRIGTRVEIESQPHEISLNMVLSKMEPDPDNPENSTYTFGVKPRTLSEAVIRSERETSKLSGKGRGGSGGGGKSIQEEAQDILRWAKINVDEANANINLNAGEINKLTGRMSQAEIDIDGANANINLNAQRIEEATGRITQAEINIDGANANISLNASAINNVTGRVSAAEIEIDGLASQITLKADKIDLQGYVTASQLSAELAALENGIADEMYIGSFSCGTFHMGGNGISFGSKTFLTSGTSLTVNASGGTVTGVTLNRKTDTIYYLDWE